MDRTDVFVFVDALGWDLVGTSGFLSDILPERKPLEMQFGYSCTAIPTILSGVRPSEHGHLGLFRYAPAESPFKGVARAMSCLRPRSFWNRGRVRGWLSKAVKKILRYTGYFQLYNVSAAKLPYMDYCEKDNLFVRGGMGAVPNLADTLAASGLAYHISDWHLSDAESIDRALAEIRKGTRFVFLYTSALDAARHDRCADVKDRLDWYEGRLREVYRALKESGREFSMTVFSDHGMTPLTKTIDLKSAVEATGLRFGDDYGACYDSTLLRVYRGSDGGRWPDRLRTIMSAVKPFEGDGHWLSEDEERRHGIYRADRSFGDAIFLVEPGVQICPSDMGEKPLNAMHGFDPRDGHSLAAVMSTEPIPETVVGVWNLFSLMAAVLRPRVASSH